MRTEIDTMDNGTGDLLPKVYNAYLVDEEGPPSPKPLSYRLGRAAGSVIALAGFVNRVIQVFRPRRGDGQRPGSGGGQQIGRGRGRGKRHRRMRR